MHGFLTILPNTPRDICYYTVDGEIFLLERSTELVRFVKHNFPCTSVAFFLLWTSSLLTFLKVMTALSAVVLPC